MKKRLAELASHRHAILNEIEFQRMEVAEISRHWQKPLVLVDAGLKVVSYIRNHPALMAGGAAALLILRRKGIVGLAQKVWGLLFLYPSILSSSLKYLSLATHYPSEKRNTETEPPNPTMSAMTGVRKR